MAKADELTLPFGDHARVAKRRTECADGQASEGTHRHVAWDVCVSVLLLVALCAMAYRFGGRSIAAVVSALIFVSGYVLLAGLEFILPTAGPRKSNRRWWMHLQLTLISWTVGIFVGTFLVSYVAKAMANQFGFELGLIDLTIDSSYGIVGLLGAGILAAIAGDFFYYWFHRAFHVSTILWQHHKLHHIDPEFDALTAQRHNWLEDIFVAVMVFLPSAILFKTDASSFVDVGIVNGTILYIFWMSKVINHSNLRIQFGSASVLWTSSQTHRIHHSLLPEHRDKNFVAFFPLWDIVFGTYCAPKWNEFPPTGVAGEREVRSHWEVQIFTFREWWKMLRKWRRRKAVPVQSSS